MFSMIEYADVIVDLQSGDSGKGKIASHLAESESYTHVVRYNGSNNAGHTIILNDKKIVTHSIPVGVLHGKKSIIGSGCALNVKHFFNELEELNSLGIKTEGLIKIASNVHVITDAHLEQDSFDKRIGTTNRGNGPAYRDKYDRKGIRAFEVKELQNYIVDIYEEFYSSTDSIKILFEGAQGFNLDIDWGDYPYVTSSHCTVGSAVMNGVAAQKIRKVYGAAKIYETYVGAKKFEPDDVVFSKIRLLGNEFGATTGRARQCNWLDVDNLKKAIDINGVTDLVISKIDVLRRLGTWKVYEGNKKVSFLNEESMINFLKDKFRSVKIYISDSPSNIGTLI